NARAGLCRAAGSFAQPGFLRSFTSAFDTEGSRRWRNPIVARAIEESCTRRSNQGRCINRVDELAENVNRSGGVDKNVATNQVGKTSHSSQCRGRVHRYQ